MSKKEVLTPKIFVQIASYRDPECQWTVKDLFEKAAKPERIVVGICLQQVPGEDDGMFENSTCPQQVRINYINAFKSKGVCWARSITQSLWQGEEYTLQIDSHMRFEPSWDETLITMLRECDSPKPILSTYPQGYLPPNNILSRSLSILAASHFDSDGILRFKGNNLGDRLLIEKPLQGALISGGFFFTKGSFISEVPYDPNLYFFGEEISLAVRAYTHGWDIFSPNRSVIYHYYAHAGHTIRKTHFSDNDQWHLLNAFALKRVRYMLGTEVSDEQEVLKDLHIYGLGKTRSLQDYQNFSGINFKAKTISENAADEIFNEQSITKRQPRIFVQIASYRDPECQWTVKDLFEQATYPERIFVGICWQFIAGEDEKLFEVVTRPKQVRTHLVDARDSQGACWARSITQSLWQGEEYTLQIDSHMRFEEGWDETLISMLSECDSPKAILGTYAPGYTPPYKVTSTQIVKQAAGKFKDGVLLMEAHYVTDPVMLAKPIRGAFFSGNFCFGPSAIISDVPYDPNLYFFGEEISMAVRLWTHGWDLYHPNKVIMYHYWDRSNRPTHFTDHKSFTRLNDNAYKRVKHLLGTEISNEPEIIKDLDIYGLGRQRSLKQYEEYAGVDFARQTITNCAKKGIFGTGRKPILATQEYVKQIFSQIYLNHSWASQESRSGWGSEIMYTLGIRKFMADFLISHRVNSIVDLGCGDFNWQKELNLKDISYIGYDIVDELISSNNKSYAGENKTFICDDVIELDMPNHDLIICKDLFPHLNNYQILKILLNVKKSGAKYFIASSDYSHSESNLDINTGEWRAVNLTKPPFNLPEPLCIIPNGGLNLALWYVQEIDFSNTHKDLLGVCDDYWDSYNPVPDLLDVSQLPNITHGCNNHELISWIYSNKPEPQLIVTDYTGLTEEQKLQLVQVLDANDYIFHIGDDITAIKRSLLD